MGTDGEHMHHQYGPNQEVLIKLIIAMTLKKGLQRVEKL